MATGVNEITVLVTGGSGLVGHGIQLVLEEYPEYVRSNEKFVFMSSKDADLCDLNSTKEYFAKVRPTHVIHLAARVAGLFGNLKNGLDLFRQNILINDNVLLCSHLLGVKKVVSCLSSCIFPDRTEYPLREEMVHNGPPHESNAGYAYAKRMLDVLSRAYRKQHGSNFVCVVPCNVFGPHDNFHLEDSHVLPGLIHRLYLAKQDGSAFTIWGSGRPLRQFIYSLDLGKLMLWAMRSYDEADPIIMSVSESDEVSIEDVTHKAAKAIQFCGDIKYDHTKSDGQYRKPASNDKLKKLLPDFTFTPFDDALQRTVTWFETNYDTVRK